MTDAMAGKVQFPNQYGVRDKLRVALGRAIGIGEGSFHFSQMRKAKPHFGLLRIIGPPVLLRSTSCPP